MTPFDKPAQFPRPFIPEADRPMLTDPFAGLTQALGGRPQMPPTATGGGGGTSATITTTPEAHPWEIVIDNVYDVTVPETPVWVSATAQIRGGSVVYQGFGSFTSTHTVTNIGSTFTPVHGDYLILTGVVSGSLSITSITLSQTSSLGSRMTFSGSTQTGFIVVVGRFIQQADDSFISEGWVQQQLTKVSICVTNPALYLV